MGLLDKWKIPANHKKTCRSRHRRKTTKRHTRDATWIRVQTYRLYKNL